FFQAEDGIRDRNVTGVQTCALPIFQFWKKAMKLDYDPNVKVQMIRPKNKYKSDIQSAIDETAKYPVKDTDFMTDDEEKNLKRLSDLEEGLHRKRLISYGGLLK